ncbi:MAG TPA: RNA polymerase sigma factor [Verrucomicrobiae bacterium]|jgi:RNA polymerase sigma-70 factor (ECF subfamily)
MDPEKLVAGLKNREPAAIEALVEEHGNRLLRSATLMCGNESTAQDLVQDTFVQALRSAHRFRGQSGLYTWLHSILLNLTRHHWRDNQKLVIDGELAEQNLPVLMNPPSISDAEYASMELARALGRLSEPHREVLVLRYFEHMKIQDMARHLGISEGTVKSRLHYAIGEMQKLLPCEMNLFSARGTKEMA